MLAGCAERRAFTWDDAVPTHSSARPPAAPPDDARFAGGAEPVEAGRAHASRHSQRREDSSTGLELGVQSGPRIDRALSAFRARRATSGALPRTSAAHGALWLDVLDEIDRACVVAPVADDLGAFVRARVTLEVEYQNDRERRRVLPGDLEARIHRALASVDARVNELRMTGAIGPVTPSPSLDGAAVVLHAPLEPMLVTSAFGVRSDPVHGRRRFHAGVDLGAPEGTLVYASAPGIVIYAGWQGGFGRHIVLDHGFGVRTHYSHLSQLFVKPGEIIEPGDTLGAVGSTGRSTGPHLHFAVTNGEGHFLDPLTVLGVPLDDETRTARTPTSRPASTRVSLASRSGR